jgi:hypothetical protein
MTAHAAPTPTNTPPADTRKVPYRRLDGGLNTRKAPHDLNRNELAALVNYWYAYGTALSKRPGTPLLGATGDGVGITSVVTARFNNNTYVVLQTAANNVWASPLSSWTPVKIGTVTGGILRGAQMFDEATGLDTLFLVTGVDIPQMWHGPSTTLVNVATGSSSSGNLPNKPNTSTPITPAFVSTLGNNSHLFYSGEPTAKSAVYVSDPFAPESFTTPAMQADPYGYMGSGGTFNPALIGFNDGVDGGDITGLQTLGFAMIVFKQSAIYAMVQTQLLGNVAWQVYNVSPSRGALSPRSIVAFDNFVAFLSIDGIYITYGQPIEQLSKQKISNNVPTYFDSTGFGQSAQIANRTNAVAGRIGNRYLVFIDTGTGQPTTGVWFDFDVTADQSLPAAGEFDGMIVGGMASASGPNDQGLLVWGDASVDRCGEFGIGFADFGAAITTQIAGKNDAFETEFGPEATIMNKVPARCTLVVEPISQAGVASTLNFAGTFAANNNIVLPAALPLPPIDTAEGGGEWGENWGGFNWTSPQQGGVAWSLLTMRPQKALVGYVLQIGIIESSIYPYILVGWVFELNERQVSR